MVTLAKYVYTYDMALVYNNDEVTCAVEVHDWREHGLEFRPGMGHNRARKNPPYLMVLHWTGGERGNKNVYNTLKTRDYGVHFGIDYYGNIHQYCDPALVTCAHVGKSNSYTFGVEIQNRGFPPSIPSRTKYVRNVYQDIIRNKLISMCFFTPAQSWSALALANAFVNRGVIEQQVPRVLGMPRDICGTLLRDTVLAADRHLLRGVCGHFHLSSRKCDPGTDLLETFIEAGY